MPAPRRRGRRLRADACAPQVVKLLEHARQPLDDERCAAARHVEVAGIERLYAVGERVHRRASGRRTRKVERELRVVDDAGEVRSSAASDHALAGIANAVERGPLGARVRRRHRHRGQTASRRRRPSPCRSRCRRPRRARRRRSPGRRCDVTGSRATWRRRGGLRRPSARSRPGADASMPSSASSGQSSSETPADDHVESLASEGEERLRRAAGDTAGGARNRDLPLQVEALDADLSRACRRRDRPRRRGGR